MTGEDADGLAGAAESEAMRRKRMLDRIYAAMEGRMLEIETRLARNAEAGCVPGNAADNERDVRTLNTLMRMIEKITVLTAAAGAAEGEGETDPEAEAADAERLRDEIAERIIRLRRSRAVSGCHGGDASEDLRGAD